MCNTTWPQHCRMDALTRDKARAQLTNSTQSLPLIAGEARVCTELHLKCIEALLLLLLLLVHVSLLGALLVPCLPHHVYAKVKA